MTEYTLTKLNSFDSARQPKHRRLDLEHFSSMASISELLWKYQKKPNQETRGYLLQPYKNEQVKPPIVFLHGGGNDCFYPHRLLFAQFLQQGHPVLTINLPGHGSEDSDTLNFKSCWNFSNNLALMLDHALKKMPYHLIGYSLGGLLLLYPPPNPSCISQSLIATPYHFVGIKASHIGEICSFFRPYFWAQLKQWNSFYHALPALGRWKRSAFPVRCSQQYMLEIAQIWDHYKLQTPLEIKIEKSPKPIHLILGKLDRLAEKKDWERVLKKSDRLHTVNSTHFDILFHPSLFEIINQIISNEPQH